MRARCVVESLSGMETRAAHSIGGFRSRSFLRFLREVEVTSPQPAQPQPYRVPATSIGDVACWKSHGHATVVRREGLVRDSCLVRERISSDLI